MSDNLSLIAICDDMVEDTLLRLSCKCDNIKVHTYVFFITKRLSHMELLLHYLRFLSRIVNRVAAAVATTRNFYGHTAPAWEGRPAGTEILCGLLEAISCRDETPLLI